MSILIQGMEMPQNCTCCPICCGLPYQHRDVKGRRPDCPLIELPPHGRLIDADKLKSRLIKDIDSPQVNGIYTNILHWISIQETVIEAEGSET